MGVMRRVSTSRKPVKPKTGRPKALEPKAKSKARIPSRKVQKPEPLSAIKSSTAKRPESTNPLLLQRRIRRLEAKFKPLARKFPELKNFDLVRNVSLNAELEISSLRRKAKDPIKRAFVDHLDGEYRAFTRTVNKFIKDPNPSILDVVNMERRAISYSDKYQRLAKIFEKG